MGLPAFMLFVALVILAGRLAIATQAVEASASEAARVASIARTQGAATSAATTAATSSLANQNVHCVRSTVTVDTAGFDAPVGTPAQVTATVALRRGPSPTCPFPASPAPSTVTATATSPIDTYREEVTHDPTPPQHATAQSAAR